MKNLKTVTQVFAGGKWLPAGSPLPGDLPNFDYEKHAAKGLIEDAGGDEIRNPTAQVEVPEVGTELERLHRELQEAQHERDGLRAEHDRLTETHRALGEQLGKVRDSANADAASFGQRWEALEAQLAEAQASLQAAQQERDELTARPTIPPDALQRLIDVKGVGDKLAPVILDALTAPAKAQ